jgi:hypothetical protein
MKKMMLFFVFGAMVGSVQAADRLVSETAEIGLKVPTDSWRTLSAIVGTPDKIKAFGGGDVLEKGQVSLRFKPKIKDTDAQNILMLAQRAKPHVSDLYIACSANSVYNAFNPNVLIKSTKHDSYFINLDTVIKSIPFSVRYVDNSGLKQQITGAGFMANLLIHIAAKDDDSVIAQLALLDANQGRVTVARLKGIITDEHHDRISQLNVNWFDGIHASVLALSASAAKAFEKHQKQLAKQTLNLKGWVMKDARRVFSGIGIGIFASLAVYFAFLRNNK